MRIESFENAAIQEVVQIYFLLLRNYSLQSEAIVLLSITYKMHMQINVQAMLKARYVK
jgi:hypothetical protein